MGAEGLATTGDTIYVNGGTYAEVVNVVFSKGISWLTDGTVTVTNGGAGGYAGAFAGNTNTTSLSGFTFNGTGKTQAFQVTNGAGNKTLSNCTFTSNGTYDINFSGTSTAVNFQNNILNGTPATAGIVLGNPSTASISANTHNYQSARGYYTTTDTAAISITNDVWNATLTNKAIDVTGTANINVSGHTGTISGTTSAFVSIATASKTGNVTISNNNITVSGATTAPWAYIVDGSHAVTISNNTVVKSSSTENQAFVYVLNQPAPIISGNTFTASNTSSNIAVGINIASTGTTVGAAQIINNIVTSSQTTQAIILVGSDTPSSGDNKINDAIITGNQTYGALDNTAVHGIEYGYNNNGNVSQNYVYGGGYGIVIKGNNDAYTTGKVAYNVLKDQSTEQIRIKGQLNVPVYNNTLYISPSRSVTNSSIYVTVNAQSSNVPATGTIIKNNLLYTQSGLTTIQVDTNSASGLIVDNNLHYLNGGSFHSIVGSTTYTSLAQWQTAGYDVHGMYNNPLFVNAGTNFSLSGSSPAINAGTDVSLTQDKTGSTSVPQGSTPDIGAYEFFIPGTPTSLAQYKSDGSTTIATGIVSNENIVALKSQVSSPNASDSLSVQVEVQPIGVSFTNSPTSIGSSVVYTGTPVMSSVTVTGLSNGNYHWQIRSSNAAGQSAWVSYGGNAESSTDFQIDAPLPTPTPIATSQSGSISQESNSSNICTAQRPGSAPTLFQIDREGTTASLYITPPSNPYSRFIISYGINNSTDQYSAIFDYRDAKGALKYKINALNPKTTYSFKVQAANGCMSGDWSNTVVAAAVPIGTKKSSYLNGAIQLYLKTKDALFRVMTPKITPKKETVQPEPTNKITEPSTSVPPTNTKPAPTPTPVNQPSQKSWWQWLWPF